MTNQSSALTTVSTLLNRALEVTLGALSKWSPILFVSATGAMTLYQWQYNPQFRGILSKEAAPAIQLLRAVELCHLHEGRLLFGTEPQNYVTNGGVRCGFKDRRGVVSLLNEYDAMGQLVLYRIEPYAKYTTN